MALSINGSRATGYSHRGGKKDFDPLSHTLYNNPFVMDHTPEH